MRALVFTRYGGPDVLDLAEVSAPTPGPGQVLIRTRAVGLNPVDALQREGTFKALDPYRFPKVAGNELSGVVAERGDDVHEFTVGDPVIARVDPGALGAFAELVATDADFVAPAPRSLCLADAAGLPLAGLTAQQALGPAHLDVQPGERLLITGAAGGVGQLAVQLARRIGAQITVTASPTGAEILRTDGADHVIDYREQKVSEAPGRYEKVLDLVGGETLEDLFAAVEPGGRVVTLAGPPSPGSLAASAHPTRRPLAAVASRLGSRAMRARAAQAGVSYEFFLMHPDGPGLAALARFVDVGELRLRIDSRFDLEGYAAAFERLESRRSKGKVVIEFPA